MLQTQQIVSVAMEASTPVASSFLALSDSPILSRFLDGTEVLKLCLTSTTLRTIVRSNLRESNADLFAAIRLVVERHRYKDKQFTSFLRRLESVQFLEIDFRRPFTPKAQRPYLDLLARNASSLRSLQVTVNDRLNPFDAFSELTTALVGVARSGFLTNLRVLEISAALLNPLMIAAITGLEVLKLVGGMPLPVEKDNLSCALACLSNLREIHCACDLVLLESLVSLRKNLVESTLLEDDGSIFGRTTTACNTYAHQLVGTRGLSHPSRSGHVCGEIDLVFVEHPVAPSFGVAQAETYSPHGEVNTPLLPAFRKLYLDKYPPVSNSFSDDDQPFPCDRFLLDMANRYPELTLSCKSLRINLSDRRWRYASSCHIVRSLAAKAERLTVEHRSTPHPYTHYPGSAFNGILRFDALTTLKIGFDEATCGDPAYDFISRHMFSTRSVGQPVTLQLSFPRSEEGIRSLAATHVFTNLPRFVLHLPATSRPEGDLAWCRCVSNLLINPNIRHRLVGLNCESLTENVLPALACCIMEAHTHLRVLKSEECDSVDTSQLPWTPDPQHPHGPSTSKCPKIDLGAFSSFEDDEPRCSQCALKLSSQLQSRSTSILPTTPQACCTMPTFGWSYLRVNLPCEYREWLVAVIDLCPQLTRVQLVAPASASNIKTVCEEHRTTLRQVPKLLRSSGFDVRVRCENGNDEHSIEQRNNVMVVDARLVEHDDPPARDCCSPVPLALIFQSLKSSEVYLLNLLDLYVEEFLPLLANPKGSLARKNIVDRISWFFRRSQSVRTALANCRAEQRRCLQLLLGDDEKSERIARIIRSQVWESESASDGDSKGCPTCQPDFDWFVRKKNLYPPFGSKGRTTISRLRSTLDLIQALGHARPDLLTLARHPARTVGGSQSLTELDKLPWTNNLPFCNLAPNELSSRGKQNPSGCFLEEITEDEVAKWCVENLIKYNSLAEKLIHVAGKPRVMNGSQAFRRSTIEGGGSLLIPADFEVGQQCNVRVLDRRVTKSLCQVVLSPTGTRKTQPCLPTYRIHQLAEGFEVKEPSSPSRGWTKKDIPMTAPFALIVRGLHPSMKEDDVFEVFAPIVKVQDVLVIRDTNCVSQRKALMEFKSRREVMRALLQFHGIRYVFNPPFESPAILKLSMDLVGCKQAV
eukprot:GHVN01050876.1.p1 GENE.GHVN01050876.1~~GHVN01050876.1.p1  ORF type:complete len:1152 (-),score=37.14 GHVN01050876.1:1796-5251(-)